MELKNYKNEDLFFCSSIRLFHFMKANGFWYLYKERNLEDEKYFYWVFEKTPKFKEALTFYTKNN